MSGPHRESRGLKTEDRRTGAGRAATAGPRRSTSGSGTGPGTVRIRPIRDADVAAVVDLWRECGLVRPWNDPHRDIECARAGTSSEILVAETGDGGIGIAGSVMAGFDGHRAWVYYVAVAPEHRSHGLGGTLMRHAERWLAGLGASKVMLMIRPENEGVRRFYDGLGYEVEERVIMSRRMTERSPAESK